MDFSSGRQWAESSTSICIFFVWFRSRLHRALWIRGLEHVKATSERGASRADMVETGFREVGHCVGAGGRLLASTINS